MKMPPRPRETPGNGIEDYDYLARRLFKPYDPGIQVTPWEGLAFELQRAYRSLYKLLVDIQTQDFARRVCLWGVEVGYGVDAVTALEVLCRLNGYVGALKLIGATQDGREAWARVSGGRAWLNGNEIVSLRETK